MDQVAQPAASQGSRLERIELHFTPTSSSWMNLVERVFRDLTVDCVPLASDELTLMHKAASLGHLCPRDAVTFFGSSRATAYRRLQHL